MARLALWLGSLGVSVAHYLYLKEGMPGEALVTFGESGAPGPAALLSMVAADVLVMSTARANDSRNLTLAARGVGAGDAELVGSFSGAPPYRLQLAATFGIFHATPPVTLLKYTSSADVVSTQSDWWDLQEWGMQSGLEITVRDPYANQTSYGGSPGDQCEPGRRSEGGAACVVAVVRFRGALLQAVMNVTTYSGDGGMISTTSQPAAASGVVILKVPLNPSKAYTEVLARVSYREPAPGRYGGKAYDVVDHWATAYARIARAPAEGTLVV